MFEIQGFFSINVQAACIAKDVFRWVGSVNDSNILKRSELYPFLGGRCRYVCACRHLPHTVNLVHFVVESFVLITALNKVY
jgi:hypothetical protein